MAPPVLICGSMAFDTIAVFEGRFKEHIMADRIQSLSVSFLVPSMRKEYGGCSGNIAYNLNLLGGHPVPVATALVMRAAPIAILPAASSFLRVASSI